MEASHLDNKGNVVVKESSALVIQKVVHTQRKEIKELHRHPLFKEFAASDNKRKHNRAVENDSAPAFDDVRAEGSARLFDLIKQTAVKDDKPPEGIWASFGKPYVCMGEPKEPDSHMPKLYRDELRKKDNKTKPNARSGSRRNAASASRPSADAAAADGDTSSKAQPDALQQAAATAIAKLARINTTVKATNVDEQKLLGSRSKVANSPLDFMEARFPASVLQASQARLARVRNAATSFVRQDEALGEATDGHGAFGSWDFSKLPPSRKLLLVQKKHELEAAGPAAGGQQTQGGAPGTTFLTQTSGMGSGGAALWRGNSVRPTQDEAAQAGGQDGSGDQADPRGEGSRSGSQGGTAGGAAGASGPKFLPLVEPVIPAYGDEQNPVYRWRNDFVSTRQGARQELQQALWERAEGRLKARSTSHMAAEMASALLNDLDLTRGVAANHAVSGLAPMSPFLKMEIHSANSAQRMARAKNTIALESEEVRVLQRFYDQLCALVETQKMSDPLSLMIIHKVKALLEKGVFLHKPLLVAILQHVLSFTKGCGMVRYNPFLLPILTFVSKCVGVAEEEMIGLIASHDLVREVYGDAPPALLTDIVAARAQGKLARRKDGGAALAGASARRGSDTVPPGVNAAVAKQRSAAGVPPPQAAKAVPSQATLESVGYGGSGPSSPGPQPPGPSGQGDVAAGGAASNIPHAISAVPSAAGHSMLALGIVAE